MIICDTVNGKGISWMESIMEWHAGTIDAEQRELALAELRPKIVP